MPRPKRKEIEVPLLLEIYKSGGEASWRDLTKRVATHFPHMTTQEMSEPGSRRYSKWEVEVRWVSWELQNKGEIKRGSPHQGIWRITEDGIERLRSEERIPKDFEILAKRTPETIHEHAAKPPPPKRHDELKQKMIDIGKKLGYYVSAEEGPEYRHDVLWKITQYKTPSHVIEVCEGGVLAKDFDSLNWARENWDARGILIVTDDKDFTKASRRLAGQPRIIAVKAETIDLLYELINADLELLKSIFGEHSKW